MSTLILHQYAGSPFSEMLRLIFGLEGLGLTAHEVVLRRRDERAGTVHVHFPRIGFQTKEQG